MPEVMPVTLQRPGRECTAPGFVDTELMVTDGLFEGDTEIATPLLKIDPGASTALALITAPVKLAHAARARSRARTCAGV
jgi:hypothetical protein